MGGAGALFLRRRPHRRDGGLLLRPGESGGLLPPEDPGGRPHRRQEPPLLRDGYPPGGAALPGGRPPELRRGLLRYQQPQGGQQPLRPSGGGPVHQRHRRHPHPGDEERGAHLPHGRRRVHGPLPQPAGVCDPGRDPGGPRRLPAPLPGEGVSRRRGRGLCPLRQRLPQHPGGAEGGGLPHVQGQGRAEGPADPPQRGQPVQRHRPHGPALRRRCPGGGGPLLPLPL